MHLVIQNFLTFPKYQNKNFEKMKIAIFLPQPPSEGGTKKMKISKIGHRA